VHRRRSGDVGQAPKRNRLPEQAVWDFDLLRGHFRELIKLDFDVELTGTRSISPVEKPRLAGSSAGSAVAALK
jgi:hypothetical protein